MSTHTSVLLQQAVQALAIKPDGCYIDATFGRGGHSAAILAALSPKGRLLALDKDESAVEFGKQRFATDDRFVIVHSSFAQLQTVAAAKQWVGAVDGVLLDLGVSSPQLDIAERGFSFIQQGPLDMRMNTQQSLDAAGWINHADEKQIADVIFQYGEERYSRRIAKAIVTARQQQAIETTTQLADIVKQAHPRWDKHKHPATRTFQAIRIFINAELDELKQVLAQSVDVLATGGRLAVISFHSLEDRIVKQFMKLEAKGKELPRHLPLTDEQLAHRLKIVSKPIKPHSTEVDENIRSRSAVLRVAEKL